MKKLFIALTAGAMAACTQPAGYVIEGEFENVGNGTVVLTMADKGKTLISDTVAMEDGRFTFEGTAPFVGWSSLNIIPQGKEALKIGLILENSTIGMTGDWNSLGTNEEGESELKEMQITGAKNDAVNRMLSLTYGTVKQMPEFAGYREWEKRMLDDPESIAGDNYWTFCRQFDAYMARVKQEQLKIIMANPASEAAAAGLEPMMNDMPLDSLEGLFNRFTPEVRQSLLATPVRENIELRQRIEPGRPAPAFTLPQRDGTTLSLAGWRGKVVVLDFWASWCKPCRNSFPWVKEFYKEFKDKGVEIVSISIDENRASWEKALDAEQLPWPQLLDKRLEGNGSEVAELYHVLAVPMFVVVGKDGNIVVRDHMEKEELTAQVEKALAE